MIYEGNLQSTKGKFLLLASRFNLLITQQLKNSAKECLLQHGIKLENIDEMWVPGAYELPMAAKRACLAKKYVAIIPLGCIIRGGTSHFDFVAGSANTGLANVSLQFDIPFGMGLLTTENVEQAMDRAGVKLGNKGWQAAESALYMVNMLYNFS